MSFATKCLCKILKKKCIFFAIYKTTLFEVGECDIKIIRIEIKMKTQDVFKLCVLFWHDMDVGFSKMYNKIYKIGLNFKVNLKV